MERKPGRPRALTVDAIAQAALDDGIVTFSMPSVARRLGVVHSGLYRYVADRDELLVSAIDLATREAAWPSADLAWEELLRTLGDSAWQLCDRYVGLDLAVLAVPRTPPAIESLVGTYVTSIQRQGFDLQDAAAAVDLIIALALTSHTEKQRLATITNDDRRDRYDRKLQMVLAGLAARAGRELGDTP